MASLFALGDALRAADAAMEDSVDEATGIIEADAAAEFDRIEGELDSKLLDWMRWAKSEKAYVVICRVEAARMTANAQAAERKQAWIASGIAEHLGEGRTVRDGTGKLSWRMGPAKVDITGTVAEQYRRMPKVPWEPDKVALLRDLKAGKECEGAELLPGKPGLVIG